MPRRLRDFVPGFSYHLTQRGNRKSTVFIDDTDRRVYLKLVRENCSAQKVSIWAYSLMDSHVHHIVVGDEGRSISRAFQRIHGAFALYFNTRHLKTGHLWQGRFKACVLDEPHLWNAVRYVERNPVRAGIVDRAEDYQWSSAAAHCGLRDDPILGEGLPLIADIPNWSTWLSEGERQEDIDFIRERTRTGRPCSSDDFARALEARLGRSLLPRKRGPKRKEPGRDPSGAREQENLVFE
jgi:putative transposase